MPMGMVKPPNPDGTPTGVEFAVTGGHPWATREGLQRQRGDTPIPQNYSPAYVNTYGYRTSQDNLGLSYIQNTATPEAVQAAMNQFMETQGIATLEQMVAEKIGTIMGQPGAAEVGKRRKIAGKYSSAPGVGAPKGTAAIDITEPLSQTQFSGPKQTTFQEAASQMIQGNLQDEYMLRGGTNAQTTNIPPNFMLRDPYSGQMVRSDGYSVPQMNPLTQKMELRHQTDMGGNMYKTVSPYYYNGSNYA
jgi:hypothetical protein